MFFFVFLWQLIDAEFSHFIKNVSNSVIIESTYRNEESKRTLIQKRRNILLFFGSLRWEKNNYTKCATQSLTHSRGYLFAASTLLIQLRQMKKEKEQNGKRWKWKHRYVFYIYYTCWGVLQPPFRANQRASKQHVKQTHAVNALE